MNAKKIYEKIVLTGHTPSEQELSVLRGTKWGKLLNGDNVVAGTKTFKTYVEDEEGIANTQLSRPLLADMVLDKIEDKFDIHFSSFNIDANVKQVQMFAIKLINNASAANGDKLSLINSIKSVDNVSDLLTKLGLASS